MSQIILLSFEKNNIFDLYQLSLLEDEMQLQITKMCIFFL